MNQGHHILAASSRNEVQNTQNYNMTYIGFLGQQAAFANAKPTENDLQQKNAHPHKLAAAFQQFSPENDPTLSPIGHLGVSFDYMSQGAKMDFPFQFNMNLTSSTARSVNQPSTHQNVGNVSDGTHMSASLGLISHTQGTPSLAQGMGTPNLAPLSTPHNTLRIGDHESPQRTSAMHSVHASPQRTSAMHSVHASPQKANTAYSVHASPQRPNMHRTPHGSASGSVHEAAHVMGMSLQDSLDMQHIQNMSMQLHGQIQESVQGSNIQDSCVQKSMKESLVQGSVPASGNAEPEPEIHGLGIITKSPHPYIKEEFLSLSSKILTTLRKRPRDEDTRLKQLAVKAAPFSLGDLATKIKTLEACEADPTDTLLTLLANSKESRHDMPYQLFAMSWVQQAVEISHSSVVPRNRIYARYVQLCANCNLNPLAPANFGKVLRMLFPKLKTRRLGVRGKSKYHYCGIKLVGDQSPSGSPASTYSLGLDLPQSLNPHTPPFTLSPSISNALGTPISAVQVNDFHTVNLKYVPGLFNTIEMSMGADTMNQPLNIPSIYTYLAKAQDIDYDVADTLQLLYKVHCTLVFELLRYMQVLKLFNIFTSFTAILTSPVFKLLTTDVAMEWVKDCDLYTYRLMLKMLTRLHLLAVPDEIKLPLKELATNYVNKLSDAFSSKFPKKFVAMKLAVARQFDLVLKRLLKCIETGSLAARILANANEKGAMLSDWLQLDMHEIVMREVPCALENAEILIDILDTRLVKLFEAPPDVPVLKTYASFLFDLPNKFTKINPWLFTLVCSNLLTTCLREMSLGGARSFGLWWVVRCWVDEYLAWCFELGGFLYDEFRSQFEVQVKMEDMEQQSANMSSSLDTSDLKAASLVDLLDGLHDRSENEWI